MAECALEPAEELGRVGRLTERRGGEGDDDVGTDLFGCQAQAPHRPDRQCRTLGWHAAGAGDLGAQVEEGTSADHR